MNNRAAATTSRNLTAPSASFTAAGDGASTVTAKASAEGEAADPMSDADSQKSEQTDFADDRSGKTNDDSGQSASSSDGNVGVAAALALNVSESIADASVDGVTINGDLTLAANDAKGATFLLELPDRQSA